MSRTGVLSDVSVLKHCAALSRAIPLNRPDLLLKTPPNTSGVYSRPLKETIYPSRPATYELMISSLERLNPNAKIRENYIPPASLLGKRQFMPHIGSRTETPSSQEQRHTSYWFGGKYENQDRTRPPVPQYSSPAPAVPMDTAVPSLLGKRSNPELNDIDLRSRSIRRQ